MDWTFRQRRYQELLTLAEEYRPVGLKTDREIAERLKVNVETLALWKLMPGWWKAVAQIAAFHIGDELHEIYASMVREAKKGSVAAAKFCVEQLGVDKPLEMDITVHKDPDIVNIFLRPPDQIKPPETKELSEPDVIDAEFDIKESDEAGLRCE